MRRFFIYVAGCCGTIKPWLRRTLVLKRVIQKQKVKIQKISDNETLRLNR